mmetsp:Transcript_58032/g.131231  ORF Transcript_58032/g.131231 Transcript_58032/m.131231 type:complete len:146 (+) Transcript_58032:77-514(+)
MSAVLVYYWVPGDKDESEHPNAFEIPACPAGVKLRDFRARFPLPGTYHFRFRMRWESGFVWMDVTNEDSLVPIFEDKVFAKVLRMSWGQGRPPAAAGQRAAPAPKPAPKPPEDMLSFGEGPGPFNPAARASPPASSPAGDFDLFS